MLFMDHRGVWRCLAYSTNKKKVQSKHLPSNTLNKSERTYRFAIGVLRRLGRFQDKSGISSERRFVDRVFRAQIPILFSRNSIGNFFRMIFGEFVMQDSQYAWIGQMRARRPDIVGTGDKLSWIESQQGMLRQFGIEVDIQTRKNAAPHTAAAGYHFRSPNLGVRTQVIEAMFATQAIARGR